MTYFFDGENQFKIYILYKLDKIKRTVQDIEVDLIHEDCKPISILSYKPRYKNCLLHLCNVCTLQLCLDVVASAN